jgi:type II secretory pathway pseudopilin PulG
VLLILALVAAGFAVVQQRRAEDRQLIATARQLVAQAELARAIDPRTALRLGLAAHQLNPDGQGYASLVNTLTTTPYASTLTGHTGSVSSVAFAPTGTSWPPEAATTR